MSDTADIERAAESAGMMLTTYDSMPPGYSWSGSRESLARFAALVRAQAMEEAAKIAEKTYEGEGGSGTYGDSGFAIYGESSAAAIRAAAAQKELA